MTTRRVSSASERDVRAANRLRPACLRAALVILLSALAPGLEAQESGGRVNGVQVRVVSHAERGVSGELLGLKDESIWVLEGEHADRRFVALPLAELREVRLQRHSWSGGRIALWTGLAGGVTTVAMYGACISLEDSGTCGAVAVGWAGLWAAIGGISRLIIGPSWKRVRTPQLEDLRPYARFPQGLPEGYPPRAGERGPPAQPCDAAQPGDECAWGGADLANRGPISESPIM